ncbi:hypothetical protein JTE90_016580 [Oedothorax gibbosus]|uniref:Uncharacterized protein n=1 Tax=Oedothorax gibbosus TaxID=931172 RepID=A0AAV6UCM9_9ARAC|nr:hypothetical protein JTE90_016580 [Oedothorax gibbosus]
MSHIIIILLVFSASLVSTKNTKTTPTKDIEEPEGIVSLEDDLVSLEDDHVSLEDDSDESTRLQLSESKKNLFKVRHRAEDDASHKRGKNSTKDDDKDLVWSKKEVAEDPSLPKPSESKQKNRYKGHYVEGRYIIDEDHGSHHGGGKDGEFVLEEGNEEHHEDEHDKGYHNENKKLDDETLKEYNIKGTDQEFREGGASFDKHHKDLAQEKKENEQVDEHDEGEKFGAEALKEHKLGKHREKSVGHKKHGFKNVYHKEEYGDHKTFHDEFLDNDHQHEYDDQHENRKLEGGRFSKGYWKEGENKERDNGDQNYAWGKGGHDSTHEGHYEEGGHITGHRQGHKKREGHHEASGQRHKHAKHKVKKGKAPAHSIDHHEDYHEPHYYARNTPKSSKDIHSKPLIPDVEPPRVQKIWKSKSYSYPDDDLPESGEGYDPESYTSPEEDDVFPKEYRTSARLPEPVDSTSDTAPVKEKKRIRVPKPHQEPENHSFYYRSPQNEQLNDIPVTQDKPFVRAAQMPEPVPQNPIRVHHVPKQPHHIQYHSVNQQQNPPHHHQFGSFPTKLSPSTQHHPTHHHQTGSFPTKLSPSPHDHRTQHMVVHQPIVNQEPRNNPSQNHHQKPYPWWKQPSRQIDSAQASTYHGIGHVQPHHQNSWVPQNKLRFSEPYQHGASGHHYGYTSVPDYRHSSPQQY